MDALIIHSDNLTVTPRRTVFCCPGPVAGAAASPSPTRSDCGRWAVAPAEAAARRKAKNARHSMIKISWQVSAHRSEKTNASYHGQST
eukprot:1766533-Prymnesium_polylepis.1